MSNPETQKPVEAPKQVEPPRVGVFVCHCGMNIAGTLDIKQVVEYAKTIPDVVVRKREPIHMR